jgi:hypothetical protein
MTDLYYISVGNFGIVWCILMVILLEILIELEKSLFESLNGLYEIPHV